MLEFANAHFVAKQYFDYIMKINTSLALLEFANAHLQTINKIIFHNIIKILFCNKVSVSETWGIVVNEVNSNRKIRLGNQIINGCRPNYLNR